MPNDSYLLLITILLNRKQPKKWHLKFTHLQNPPFSQKSPKSINTTILNFLNLQDFVCLLAFFPSFQQKRSSHHDIMMMVLHICGFFEYYLIAL